MRIKTKFSIGDKVVFADPLRKEYCPPLSLEGYIHGIDIGVDNWANVVIEYFVRIPYMHDGKEHISYMTLLEDELKKVVSDENTDQVQPQ